MYVQGSAADFANATKFSELSSDCSRNNAFWSQLYLHAYSLLRGNDMSYLTIYYMALCIATKTGRFCSGWFLLHVCILYYGVSRENNFYMRIVKRQFRLRGSESYIIRWWVIKTLFRRAAESSRHISGAILSAYMEWSFFLSWCIKFRLTLSGKIDSNFHFLHTEAVVL